MNIDRLLKLADHLDKIYKTRKTRKRKFDISSWFNRRVSRQGGTCGTSACALGEACLLPSFRKQGLRLDGEHPYFDGNYNFRAGMVFFDLTELESSHLFSGGEYDMPQGKINAKHVATRIRETVAEYLDA